MFAGIDIASERHVLARLDEAGKPISVAEDRDGYDTLLRALGPPSVLIAIEATGHYWKNLFAVLAAAGLDVALLNPLSARRFQDSRLERTKTDTIAALGLACLAFEKRPPPARLHDEAAEALRELVRHCDRLRQDFDDRVGQLHRLSISVLPSSPATSAASTACSPPSCSPNTRPPMSSPAPHPGAWQSCVATGATWSATTWPSS